MIVQSLAKLRDVLFVAEIEVDVKKVFALFSLSIAP